jgi:hypothetical protein
MIKVTNRGSFQKTTTFLRRVLSGEIFSDLDRYGRMGVDALSNATPVDTSLTADSWGYRVIRNHSNPGIEWFNTNTVDGTPVAVLIQYGHGTGTGGYVQGRDYINPAMRPVFDQIAEEIWKKVSI